MSKSKYLTLPIYIFLATASIIATSCRSHNSNSQNISSISDKNATSETVILYHNLKQTVNKGIMFGHQDDLAYGVNWKYEPGRSDIKDVTGDYPAVYGWDIGGIEKQQPNNLDGVPFDKMRDYIKQAHKRGGVNTISWHVDNPLNEKSAWDITAGSLASALPGGKAHEKYKGWLDLAAAYLKSLKDDDGKLIPILYRPYHELTGNWFWWCKNNGTPEQFVTLWKFTFEYFQQKGVTNLIYVYNTAGFNTKAEFLEYYPGSAYADILSFDSYQYGEPSAAASFIATCQKQFAIMNEIAIEQNIPMAFAETGYEQVPDAQWWTGTLSKAIGNYKLSYVLVWRNHGWNEHMTPPHMHYYGPYQGHPSEKDFVKYYNLPQTLFESDIAKEKLYNK